MTIPPLPTTSAKIPDSVPVPPPNNNKQRKKSWSSPQHHPAQRQRRKPQTLCLPIPSSNNNNNNSGNPEPVPQTPVSPDSNGAPKISDSVIPLFFFQSQWWKGSLSPVTRHPRSNDDNKRKNPDVTIYVGMLNLYVDDFVWKFYYDFFFDRNDWFSGWSIKCN